MRQAVLDAAVELGYKPKNMQNEINPKICIMLENMNYENIDQFGYEIISGFEQAALRKGYNVTIVPMDLRKQTQTKYDTYMLKNGYSGAFLLGFELHDDYVQQLDTTKVPTVLLDNYISGNNYVGYVGTDNYEGIKDLINYLKELGHKNIAFLNGTKNSMITQKRLEAFIQSMNENNLPVNDALIAFGHYITDCAKDYVPGFVKNGATAIVCASDFIASGVIRELHSMGLKIPEDISVTGYDDMPIAQYLNPPLTTIRQDRISLGKSALTLLDDLMHNVSISRIELRPKFIKRYSTDKCKI